MKHGTTRLRARWGLRHVALSECLNFTEDAAMPHAFASTLKTFRTASGKTGQF